jgi:hypothetical protein
MHSFLLDEELNKGQAKAYPELAKFMSSERWVYEYYKEYNIIYFIYF